MKKKEILIFAIIFLIAAASILFLELKPASEKRTLLITVDGEEYKRISIDTATNASFSIETEDGYNSVVITNGEVDVVAADCKNQVCVNTKEATKAGDLIVCLPHKVVIEILEE
ncbi:MAG: NusG domain II-containing protein [Eubacteriales bacterium]